VAHAPLPDDTDFATREMTVERWRAMTLAERFSLVEQLCADVELLARAGIVSTDPELDEREVLHELARRRYGRLLADAAYPDVASSR
jgi:hypothetical protein